MYDLDRLSELANTLGWYSAERLPNSDLSRRDSLAIATDAQSQAAARHSLSVHRTSSTAYKDPSKQKRNILKSKKEKEALKDPRTWVYNQVERYAVLDRNIREGGNASFAQAILTLHPRQPLDVNNVYVANELGEAISTGRPTDWLDLAAARDDHQYIRLLCVAGSNQMLRNKALSIALQRKNFKAVKELFLYDADPNALNNASHFIAAIKDQDHDLYRMFLMANVPLNLNYLHQALVEAIGHDSGTVALLIAYGADGLKDNGRGLCLAVSASLLQETAMILNNPNADLSIESLNFAIDAACSLTNEDHKRLLLDLLLCAGGDVNSPSISQQMVDAVKQQHIPLVDILINHGFSSERNEAEALCSAVLSGQLELVEALLRGPVGSLNLHVSRALVEASALEDPDVYEDIAKALIEKGAHHDALSHCLSDAVEKGCLSLVRVLIEHGASLDYDNARCVRFALRQNDFSLFSTLLNAPCERPILCMVLSDAMKIEPPTERFDIMSRILEKGVSGKDLHVALQTIASEATDATDYILIQTLMQHKASVDFVDSNGNCICTAAYKRDDKALDLLCEGNPSADTVSEALGILPVSFASADSVEYAREIGMISTLLKYGAHGDTAATMFVDAIQNDHREKAVDIFIQHDAADANYNNGQAVREALKLPRISSLQKIVSNCKLNRTTIASQLPHALEPQGFDLAKVTLIATEAKRLKYRGILDKPLRDEVKVNGARKEVIKLLLSLKASVDFENGAVLQHAVQKGDIEVCRMLLAAGVMTENIALSFPAARATKDRAIRLELMKILLEKAKSAIGQNEALAEVAQEAIKFDLSHVQLLLEHGASASFGKGAAVLQSLHTRNLGLLKLFLHTKLNKEALANSFALARKMAVPKEERYIYYETILQQFNDKKQISEALVEAVQRDAFDSQTSLLLLKYGASVETDNGQVVVLTAVASSLDLLKIFLGKKPSKDCRDAAFRAANDAKLGEHRNTVYQQLLVSGVTTDIVSIALRQATKTRTVDHALLTLLMKYGASLDFDSGRAIVQVTEKSDLGSLVVLLKGNITKAHSLDRAFVSAMNLKGPPRLAIAKVLLEKAPGITRDIISSYLEQIAEEKDHDLLTLLMSYKPDTSYNSGASIVLAARMGDAKSTLILSQGKLSQETIDKAFEQMLVDRTIQKKALGIPTAKILLERGVSQHLVDRALLEAFDEEITDLTKGVVELLIPHKPSVSMGNAKAFVNTASNGEIQLFRCLASQKPDLNIVIPALIQSMKDEEVLISFLVLLEEGKKAGPQLAGLVEPDLVEDIASKQATCVEEEALETAELEQANLSPKDTYRGTAQRHDSAISGPDIYWQKEKPRAGPAIIGEHVQASPAGDTAEAKPHAPQESIVEEVNVPVEEPNQLSDSVIFTAITHFPKGNLLVRYCLDNGCSSSSKIIAEIVLRIAKDENDDVSKGKDSSKKPNAKKPNAKTGHAGPAREVMTVLIWALSRSDITISEDVIMEILANNREG